MRLFRLAFAASLVLALLGVGVPASAQTPNLAAFCAARVQIEDAQNKKATVALLDTMVPVAPTAVSAQMTELRDLYKKKGDKIFETEKGSALVTTLDGFVFDNCPGRAVAFTAIDYEYQGIPATLPAGLTKFKMTNAAPKEEHEIGIVKVKPAGLGMDPKAILSAKEKKQAKLVDFDSGTGAFAPPGNVAYGVAQLDPGTYVYACFIPVGGKKNGAPHFTEGMYGTFTVT
jgi:hypothetical protein